MRPGCPGARGAGTSVKRYSFIAALVASAVLACAGSAKASTMDSSPPAPLRAAASPRHSAAGASATATHAARSRHGHRHHRRHAAEKAELSARVPWSAAGASPPLPVRRPAAPRHPALRPTSHEHSNARHRTSGFGSAAMAARIVTSPEAGRPDAGLLDEPSTRLLSMNRGRGPPRAPPRDASPSEPHPILDSIASSTLHPIPTRPTRPAPGRSPSAPVAARRGPSHFASVTRDRLQSRPHAGRLEGAVACHGMPSSRRPS
jgi:hypothetical protein